MVFWHVISVALYFFASLFFFSHGMLSNQVFQPGADPIASIWFLNWWPYAISRGLNPLVTHYLWSPIGFSLLWATSIPTLAFLVWPGTVFWDAETTYNILCLLAPALNAYAAFLLVKYLTRNARAAFFCGYLFGFSPYVASHMLGHLNLAFVPLVPLMLLVCIRRARNQIGRFSFIATLTVLVLLQFGISTEVLATSALLGAVTYFTFFFTHRRSIDMVGLAVDTGIGAIACSVLLSPAFYFLWLGAEQVPDGINSPVIFSNDLLGFIVPMQTTWIGGEAL